MRLGLGTVQFGLPYGIANKHGQVSFDEVRSILTHAKASGLDTLDTAITYGNSEQRLGEIGITQWQLISKLPPIPESCNDVTAWVNSSVEASLQRLKIRQLRGLLLHSPEQLLGEQGRELYVALTQLKCNGLVQKIGISIYAPDELNVLCTNFSLDIVQVPYNILDHRLIDSGWLKRLKEYGIEVHVRSVFLQGLLLMQPSDRPIKFERWQPLWDRWTQWLEDTGLTPLQASLRYVLAQPGIDRVIVSVDTLAQLKEILQAVRGEIPEVPEELHCTDCSLINPVHWRSL